MSVGRRAKLDLELAEYKQRLYDIVKAASEIPDIKFETDGDGKPVLDDDGNQKFVDPRTPEQRLEQVRLDRKADDLESQYAIPAYLKVFLIDVSGLEIDGSTDITIDRVLEDGPQDLVEEIYRTILINLGLLPDEQKNSQSPSTSVAVEGGTKSNMTAESASASDTIATETA